MENLQDLQKEFAQESNPEDDLAHVREILQEDGLKLKELLEKESALDHELKQLKSNINELKDKMRSAWLPFVKGADKSEIDMDGFKLQMYKHLDVSIDGKEEAVDWFLNNGYNGVCKYDVHAQTMKRIARECFEAGKQIPGLQYKEVQLLKIK